MSSASSKGFNPRMSIKQPLPPLLESTLVMVQQGDCNAPTTFQQLMMAVFCDIIGQFIHVYLDDIFIYSNSIEEHEQYLKLVFDQL